MNQRPQSIASTEITQITEVTQTNSFSNDSEEDRKTITGTDLLLAAAGSLDSEPETKKKHECKLCNKTFSTSGHLSRHCKTQHSKDQKPFPCPFSLSLQETMEMYPNIDIQSYYLPNVGRFSIQCKAKFGRRDNMMQHYRGHLKKLVPVSTLPMVIPSIMTTIPTTSLHQFTIPPLNTNVNTGVNNGVNMGVHGGVMSPVPINPIVSNSGHVSIPTMPFVGTFHGVPTFQYTVPTVSLEDTKHPFLIPLPLEKDS